MYETIKKVFTKDYDHERPDIPRSKDFNRAYKSFIKTQIKPYGYELVKETGSGYCECSGFITDNKGNYAYFNSGDYRYSSVFDDVLIRKARNEKDYSGGMNHYCELKSIGEEVAKLFSY